MINKLHKDYDILVLTLDISDFYPSINLNYCKKLVENIIEEKGGADKENLKNLNERLFKIIETWNEKVNSRGLPIGFLPSPILANLYLREFDEFINDESSALFYGRYIDDIIIILKGDKIDFNKDPLQALFSRKLKGSLKKYEDEYIFPLAQPNESEQSPKITIKINSKKQKNFFLSKGVTPSVINAIQREINEISSLRKLMPDFIDESSVLLEKVFQIYSEGEFGDNLRKVDKVRIRRLGMSILISKLREQSKYLPSNEWRNERQELYKEIKTLLLDPVNFFENIKNVLQLIQLMAWNSDKEEILCLKDEIFQLINAVNKVEIKGLMCFKDEEAKPIKTKLKSHLRRIVEHNISIAIPSDKLLDFIQAKDRYLKIKKDFIENLKMHNLELREKIFEFLINFEHRWEFLEEYFSDINITQPMPKQEPKNELFKIVFRELLDKLKVLEEDIAKENDKIKDLNKLFRFLLFPSIRIPYIYLFSIVDYKNLYNQNGKSENSRIITSENLQDLIKLILLLGKGVLLYSSPINIQEEGDVLLKIAIRKEDTKDTINVGMTNFIVEEKEVELKLKRKETRTKEKFKQLIRIINGVINCRHNIDYILFPEFALPKDWVIYVSQPLFSRKTSLISGGEYRFRNKRVINPVYSLLYSETPYMHFYILIEEEKVHYSPRESLLIKGHKYIHKEADDTPKVVYEHQDFFFSNLICYDIADINLRSKLRGKIDALFIVALNKDLDYFNAIIESAARDLHCFVVLVNSGKYGDSRIRAPYRKDYKRDIIRIKGGKNAFFIVDTIDVKSLREFHSQLYFNESSEFKPIPPGFHTSISQDRKTWNYGS
ncbi:hypothetical protein Theam_1426 [Thermovibrio ammonificans HB-1]|uniref:Reverse transcriptase domain-containing protein n=1 Tax=Thermovibrio ammonificans (strain DSM 15698 / JCM 12110 / HB-1) TaxID=648996 RepID=E8T459_THEA1|nr:RNA-directed DNA polymerase [Thermovibrio ammonificans]ADU97388.1 hypothetical protein Theam_1426 [Thermovibrio ammonificans HB-1]